MRFQFPLLAALSLALSALAQDPVPTVDFQNEVITLHNKARAQYGAEPLTWSDALYPSTLAWAAQCKHQHSQTSANYGENLFVEAVSANIDITTVDAMASAMKSWMAEARGYPFTDPGFYEGTSHFTQVVWKATTQVACAEAVCPEGAIINSWPTKLIVCRYTPPGNYKGEYAQNVGRRI